MAISLIDDLKKIKDKFYKDTLDKITDDKQKKNLYLIYRVMNTITTWGTIVISTLLVAYTGYNILSIV